MGEKIPREERARIWGERLSAQIQSGRTIRTFCEEHQLKPYAFNYWKKKFRESPTPSRFVALSQKICRSGGSPLIHLPNGVQIDLRCDLEGAAHFLKTICGVGHAKS